MAIWRLKSQASITKPSENQKDNYNYGGLSHFLKLCVLSVLSESFSGESAQEVIMPWKFWTSAVLTFPRV